VLVAQKGRSFLELRKAPLCFYIISTSKNFVKSLRYWGVKTAPSWSNKMNDREDTYITADLYLASFLKAKGHKFVDVKTGRQVKFVFPNSEELQNHIKGYYNNDDMVKANEFTHALRDLKAIVFNLPK